MTYKKVGSVVVEEDHINVIEKCVNISEPVLLIGETGTGKTALIRELARQSKQELVRVSINGSIGTEEILGKWLAKDGSTYWQDGVLTMAMKEGFWIVFDEINAALPEVLFALHSLLDDDRKILIPEKSNETVRPHKNFRFFATMNPTEDYAGTKDVNRALLSRFHAVLNVSVLPEIEESKLLYSQVGLEEQNCIKLVKFGTALREEKKKNNIFYFCSTRDLVQAAKLQKTGLTFEVSVEHAICNKMSAGERKEIEAVIKQHIKESAKKMKTFLEMEKEYKEMENNLSRVSNENKELRDQVAKLSSNLVSEIHKMLMKK